VDEEEQFDFLFLRKIVRGVGRGEPRIENSVKVIGKNAVDVNYHSGKGDIISFTYRTYIYDGGRAPGVLTYNVNFLSQFTIAEVPVGDHFEGFVSINQKDELTKFRAALQSIFPEYTTVIIFENEQISWEETCTKV